MSALAESQERDWDVRAIVYRSFAERMRAPSTEEIAEEIRLGDSDVLESLARLEAAHQIALLPDRSGVWMANPFSAVPTAFPVRTDRGTCWANCAWDALGVPGILGVDTWTDAHCANSGEPIAFGVRGGHRIGDDGLVHLVVPPRDAWEDIGFT
jgi:hypothetical protein